MTNRFDIVLTSYDLAEINLLPREGVKNYRENYTFDFLLLEFAYEKFSRSDHILKAFDEIRIDSELKMNTRPC